MKTLNIRDIVRLILPDYDGHVVTATDTRTCTLMPPMHAALGLVASTALLNGAVFAPNAPEVVALNGLLGTITLPTVRVDVMRIGQSCLLQLRCLRYTPTRCRTFISDSGASTRELDCPPDKLILVQPNHYAVWALDQKYLVVAHVGDSAVSVTEHAVADWPFDADEAWPGLPEVNVPAEGYDEDDFDLDELAHWAHGPDPVMATAARILYARAYDTQQLLAVHTWASGLNAEQFETVELRLIVACAQLVDDINDCVAMAEQVAASDVDPSPDAWQHHLAQFARRRALLDSFAWLLTSSEVEEALMDVDENAEAVISGIDVDVQGISPLLLAAVYGLFVLTAEPDEEEPWWLRLVGDELD